MADSGHPPAELHERLLICRTIKLNAGAHGGHRRCCHAQMQKNAQNKPQIARLILCVHTTLQVYCNLFLTFCNLFSRPGRIFRPVSRQLCYYIPFRSLCQGVFEKNFLFLDFLRQKTQYPCAILTLATQSCSFPAKGPSVFDRRAFCSPFKSLVPISEALPSSLSPRHTRQGFRLLLSPGDRER